MEFELFHYYRATVIRISLVFSTCCCHLCAYWHGQVVLKGFQGNLVNLGILGPTPRTTLARVNLVFQSLTSFRTLGFTFLIILKRSTDL